MRPQSRQRKAMRPGELLAKIKPRLLDAYARRLQSVVLPLYRRARAEGIRQ